MSKRTRYEVEWASGLTGSRYAVFGYTGVCRQAVEGPSGRVRLFATKSGALRVADRLNADEHKRASPPSNDGEGVKS